MRTLAKKPCFISGKTLILQAVESLEFMVGQFSWYSSKARRKKPHFILYVAYISLY